MGEELQKEEVMHDRYEIEVGDIIQVIKTELNTQYYKLGDIGRVTEISKNSCSARVDFSISADPYVGEVRYEGDQSWLITEYSVVKINIIKEGR